MNKNYNWCKTSFQQVGLWTVLERMLKCKNVTDHRRFVLNYGTYKIMYRTFEKLKLKLVKVEGRHQNY